MNDSENTETICVKNSVTNTFRTGQTGQTVENSATNTLDDLVANTGKLPSSGSSKTTLWGNNKALHRLRVPQLEVFYFFLSVLYNLTILA